MKRVSSLELFIQNGQLVPRQGWRPRSPSCSSIVKLQKLISYSILILVVLLVAITTAGFKISFVHETSGNYIHANPFTPRSLRGSGGRGRRCKSSLPLQRDHCRRRSLAPHSPISGEFQHYGMKGWSLGSFWQVKLNRSALTCSRKLVSLAKRSKRAY